MDKTDYIRGGRHKQTYKTAVESILSEHPDPTPRIISRGHLFYNVDRWTLRVFTMHMCQWAHKNPACVPTRTEIAHWVQLANQEYVPDRYLVVANTPDELPVRTAMALTGGAYHEAWHTRYSCRRPLTEDEMCKLVLPRWAKIPNWAAVYGILQEWSNLVEDIRIERRGCEDYPGTPTKMYDLQNFILDQEAEGNQNARQHAVQAGQPVDSVKRSDLTVVSAAFRDKGLGYKTRTQQIAWQGYVSENPEADRMVTDGPLTPMLEESIGLSAEDDTGCLRVAMDCLVVLVQNSGKQDQENQDRDEAEDGQQGDGEQTCKACGAPAHQLVVRPKSDGYGNKVAGVGICTCTVCGHQEEVNVKAPSQPKNRDDQLKDAAKAPGPKWEGWDAEDFQQQGGGDSSDEGEEEQSEGQGGEGEASEENGDEQAEGASSEGEDSGEDQEGQEQSADGKGDQTGDYPDNYTDNPEETGEEGTPQPSKGETKGASMAQGSEDFKNLAEALINAVEQGEKADLLDNNTALGGSVEEAVERENGDVQQGERAYNPYSTDLDVFQLVKPSSMGKDNDLDRARQMLEAVREQTGYLRARLGNLFRALEHTDIVHGTRYGDDLSEPFLVDTALSIRAGQEPNRAFYQQDERIDTSLAVSIVIDESSSMLDTVYMRGRTSTLTEVATHAMIAIAEPLDRLGVPVMATGFRNGNRYASHHGYVGSTAPDDDYYNKGYTRNESHVTDVFKTFDERFHEVMWRFANTRGSGGTPMADGIQVALDALNYRDEGHRVMFVLTDGCPSGNYDVIQWQLRVAKEAGIHIIGVGLGSGAKYVKDLFPDYVYSDNFDEFPSLLLEKLNSLVDMSASKRGQRIAV